MAYRSNVRGKIYLTVPLKRQQGVVRFLAVAQRKIINYFYSLTYHLKQVVIWLGNQYTCFSQAVANMTLTAMVRVGVRHLLQGRGVAWMVFWRFSCWILAIHGLL